MCDGSNFQHVHLLSSGCNNYRVNRVHISSRKTASPKRRFTVTTLACASSYVMGSLLLALLPTRHYGLKVGRLDFYRDCRVERHLSITFFRSLSCRAFFQNLASFAYFCAERTYHRITIDAWNCLGSVDGYFRRLALILIVDTKIGEKIMTIDLGENVNYISAETAVFVLTVTNRTLLNKTLTNLWSENLTNLRQ